MLQLLAVEQANAPSSTSSDHEIEMTREASGRHLAQLMAMINNGSLGLSYPKPNEGGSANSEYWKVLGLSFRLVPGKSASRALRVFLEGPTTCDCNIAIVALQLDTFRALVGNSQFDAQFGAEGETDRYESDYLSFNVVGSWRVSLARMTGNQGEQSGFGGSVDWFLEPSHGSENTHPEREAQIGDWWYCANHPGYLVRHPGGYWSGENALCVDIDSEGTRYWQGFGVAKLTSAQMAKELAGAYNAPSTVPPSAEAPASVTAEEIEASMFYADDMEARGLRIDFAKAARLRDGEVSGVRRKPKPLTPEQLAQFQAILDH